MEEGIGRERVRIPGRLLVHLGVTALLVLLFIWPGGMLFDTVEPFVLGLPFYVFWEMLLMPLLAAVNIVIYAVSMRPRDRALMQSLDAGKSVAQAEGVAPASTASETGH